MHKIRYSSISIFCVLVLFSLELNSSELCTAEIEEGKIIFEVNNTDGDIGLQLKLDGVPWDTVKIFTPDGKLQFYVIGKGNMKDIGLSEIFLESEGYEFGDPDADISIVEFLEMFPEGVYRLQGTTVNGCKLEGKVELSHFIPCGPEITMPLGNPDPKNTIIRWNEVETKIDPITNNCIPSPDIDIIAYKVIVEVEDPLPKVFFAQLPASADSVLIPPEFLDYDTEYKLEILAIQGNHRESGNQTSTEIKFRTSPEP